MLQTGIAGPWCRPERHPPVAAAGSDKGSGRYGRSHSRRSAGRRGLNHEDHEGIEDHEESLGFSCPSIASCSSWFKASDELRHVTCLSQPAWLKTVDSLLENWGRILRAPR